MKKREIVGYISKHPVLEYYRMLLDGEITFEEYSKLSAENLKTIRIPIYNND